MECNATEVICKYTFYFKGPDDCMFKRFKGWFLEGREKDESEEFPSNSMLRKLDWEGAISPTAPYQNRESYRMLRTRIYVQELLYGGTFIRGDYRELCELLNFLLGGEVCSNLKKNLLH